ncbi:Ubiquitin thioesterase otubain-like protein [Grifola frondosa]|uniref:Ubiquitin thioesterase otubain-like protein n=1 Tax=Grifola frondosa TaxID=5627 RepID=A0A1C7MEP3_GRIFR|nr:Ubiquitin thioesterase otubain-like protein [Grifola frondosa]
MSDADDTTPKAKNVPLPASSPEAPRIKTSDLPDVDDSAPPFYSGSDADQEFSALTPVQLFELNQGLFDETVPERPLIAPLAPMQSLRAEYEGGSVVFVKQIDWLIKNGFIGIRRAKGDAVTSAISVLEASQPMLEEVGFQRLVFEDFYDCLVSVINCIITPDASGRILTPAMLLETFNTPEVSNSIVVYLRLLASAQMRSDPDSYAPFLFNPELGDQMEVTDFCVNFVEAVGKEADHVQITALSRALKVNISVAYLDGRSADADGKVDFVEFQNNDEVDTDPVILLYRPGHYDILDKRSEDPPE